MATLRQVAEIAGVSPATASRVLGKSRASLPVSEGTSRRVREAAERLGYRVNYHMQAVSTGRTLATGFVSEALLYHHLSSGLGDMYFGALRRGVEFTTQEAGSALMSVQPGGWGKGPTALERGAQYIAERRLDALVVPYGGVGTALLEASPDLPVVVVDPVEAIHRPQVCFDAAMGMRLIAGHLGELGHREVLWFGPVTGKVSEPLQRQGLFAETAGQAGLRVAACLADVDALGVDPAAGRIQELARGTMAGELAGPGRKWTAVVAYNDQWAVAACAALRLAGVDVPGDVSVVGFDNMIAQFCIPGLTTVDHRLYEMGRRAGALAARLVEADADERLAMCDYKEVVEPVLVVRESTGPAAAGKTA